MSKKKVKMTGRDFDALTPAEKQKIVDKLDAETPEQRRARSKPLGAADRAVMQRIAARMGRPKLGKGTKIVSVSVEIDLLKRADAYAREAGLKRAELFTLGLKSVVPVK
jgi:hypothetical protein